MQRRRFLARSGLAATGLVFASIRPAVAQGAAPAAPKERKPDLGDVAEGRYVGDVISDSKGSSRADVTLTVTRIGVNKVRITSNYPRLPVIELTLQRALDKIVQARGDDAFLYDWSRKPAKLDVSFGNEVSWSGSKQA